MIRKFFKYDCIQLWRDKTIGIVFILIFLLTGITIYNGNHWIEFQRRNVESIKETRKIQYETHIKDGEEYDKQNDSIGFDSPNNPFVIYWGLRGYAYKSPVIAGIFSIGQSDLFPYYSMLVGVDKQYLLIEEEIQNPFNQFIGKLDYAFFVIYLLPVLIIAIGFNVLASEVETGTIRLIQAQGISILKVSGFKLILRSVLVCAIAWISLLMWLFILEPEIVLPDSIASFLLLSLFLILYVIFWFSVCFLIASLCKNAIHNGLLLIGLWIIFLFIVPTFINGVAEKMYPVPSRNQQALSVRETDTYLEQQRAAILKKYLKHHPEHRLGKANATNRISWLDWYPEFLVYQDELERRVQPTEMAIRKSTALQQRFCDQFRFLSPSLLVHHTLLQTAQTSMYDQLDYAESFDLFNDQWRRLVRDKIFRRIKFTNEDFNALPQFHMVRKYNGFQSMDYLMDTLAFFAFILLTIALAFYNFNLLKQK